MIGFPISDERLHLMAAASNGLKDSFKTGDNPLPCDTAKRLVDVAKTTCHTQKNQDGVWIGDCEDCHKRLGRNCPGALWVRSRHDQLDKSLEELRKAPADKNGDPTQSTCRGDCSGCHTSGPATSTRKHRQIYPMASGLQPCFDSLKHEDLAAIVAHLCLVPRIDGTPITPRIVRQQRRHYLEHLISEFLEKPQATGARTSKHTTTINSGINSGGYLMFSAEEIIRETSYLVCVINVNVKGFVVSLDLLIGTFFSSISHSPMVTSSSAIQFLPTTAVKILS